MFGLTSIDLLFLTALIAVGTVLTFIANPLTSWLERNKEPKSQTRE